MLGNSTDHEKMAFLSSTNNQWPQNHHHHHIDEKKTFMDSTNGITAIQKPCPVPELVQQQQQQPPPPPPPPLKCPRCASSNTKFCYYNNYSLSQPRHFCKACKRYWTRGGTLRNVPVGGGCRKNKRVKRPVSAIDAVSSSSTTTTTTTSTSSAPPSQTQIDYLNPLFYGFPTNPSDMNLPFSSFNTSGFDLQPQLNGLGIGFSSDDYRNGFINNPTKQIQDIVGNSNSLFSSYNSLFTSPSLNTSSATMASVLASKFSNGGLKDGREPSNHFQTLASFDGLHMGNTDVKLEDAQNRLEWNSSHHQTQQMGPSDPSPLYWNATSVSSNWHDSSNNNIGSSVPSLI